MIYLASKSPRRAELLEKINVEFLLLEAEIEENLVLEGSPAFNAEKLAKKKCSQGIKNAIASNLENHPVLAADTIVVMGNKIYGKPKSSDHAFTMLSELSGQVHEVITGVSVGAWDSEKVDIATISVSTFVEFGDISAIELKEYSETDEPLDKAGAYAIQGYAEKFIKGIKGSYSNVVGLPLFEALKLLKQFQL